MSLLYTASALDRTRFEPVVALARPSAGLRSLYVNAGIETIDWPGLALWDHSTVAPRRLYHARSWWKLAQVALGWSRTAQRTLELVRTSRADIVHLNSMPLAPSADALTRAGVRYVWHVREPPLPAYGLRHAILRRIMLRAEALIFISDADRRSWIGDHPAEVVHNFVDLCRFDPQLDGRPVRERFGIGDDQPLILYVGGLSEAKGIDPLLHALSSVGRRVPDVRCLMPGLDEVVSGRGDARPKGKRFLDRVRQLHLEDIIVAAPFEPDIAPLIAASDVVVFPAIRPHFARPVIEASAMAKPVVASRFPVMEELVQDGVTGVLVPPGDADVLAEVLASVFADPERARSMGVAGRQLACRKFDVVRQVSRIMSVYERVLRD